MNKVYNVSDNIYYMFEYSITRRIQFNRYTTKLIQILLLSDLGDVRVIIETIGFLLRTLPFH